MAPMPMPLNNLECDVTRNTRTENVRWPRHVLRLGESCASYSG